MLFTIWFVLAALTTSNADNGARFSVLQKTGTEIHLVKYRVSQRGVPIQVTDRLTVDMKALRSQIQELHAAVLSPQGGWLVVETSPDFTRPQVSPGFQHSLTLIDMKNNTVMLQKQDETLNIFWYSWHDENHLRIEYRMKKKPEEKNTYSVVELSGPSWTEPARVVIPSSEDIDVLTHSEEGQRTPADRKMRVLQEKYRNQAAEYLGLTKYDYPYFPYDLAVPGNLWIHYLNGTSGAVSDDGLGMAARVKIGGVTQLVYFHRKRNDHQWKEEVISEKRSLWMIRFWKNWLLLGVQNPDQSQNIRFIDRHDFKLSFDVKGDLFIPN